MGATETFFDVTFHPLSRVAPPDAAEYPAVHPFVHAKDNEDAGLVRKGASPALVVRGAMPI